MREGFESGNTVQFTFVSSVAPDSAPIFTVTGPGSSGVTSLTAQTSDTTHYYALYTMPNTEGVFIGAWNAVKTLAGSAYNFKKRSLFNVTLTKVR